MIYFDHAASTVVDKEIINEIIPLMEVHFANPSSGHPLGKKATEVIEQSRKKIALSFHCSPENIHFINSATTAANLILQGYCDFLLRSNSPKNEIIISEIEHLAVSKTCEFLKTKGFKIHKAKVDIHGQVELEHLKSLLNNATAIVAIMAVNNEIGAIQDIALMSNTIKQFDSNIFFVCDFVQGIGKISTEQLHQVDAWFIAGHKIGAPKGIACFYLNPAFRVNPILFGGGQEDGFFPGTIDPVMSTVLAQCIHKILRLSVVNHEKLDNLRSYFFEQLNAHKVKFTLTIPESYSVSNIISITFDGIKGNHLATKLEEEDIFVSTRSACSSFCSDESHVIKVIQIKKALKLSPVRLSFSPSNTADEINHFVRIIKEML